MTLSKIKLSLTYLKPGEVCYTDEPALVMSSLRSGVAIVMFNKRLHFAGICHVRPVICKNSEFCIGHCDAALAHMDCATKQMLEIFEFLGIKREEIAARVFHGTDVTECSDIDLFRTILLNEGLSVEISHVEGTFGRKILFFTDTEEVLAKQIKGNDLPREE